MINYYRILHAVIVVHGVTSAARKKMTVERCSVKTDLSFELSKWQNTPQNSKEKVKIKIKKKKGNQRDEHLNRKGLEVTFHVHSFLWMK